jgi:hypothetical protein
MAASTTEMLIRSPVGAPAKKIYVPPPKCKVSFGPAIILYMLYYMTLSVIN